MAKKIKENVITGLAKIMATENIQVIFNPKAKTACFDVKNRICYLPMLKKMDDEYVYHAFVAHEMGHALYTPYSEKEYDKLMGEIPMVFLNVTEDARIEKMIKRKYPGTMRDFFQFYKKTTSKEIDFFGIKNKDISKLTVLDRINLQTKAGLFLTVNFNQEEQKLLDMVQKEVTFEDAVAAAKAIYDYMKKTGQVQEINEEDMPQDSGEGEGEEQESQGQEGDGDDNGDNQSGSGMGGEKMTVVKKKRFKQSEDSKSKDKQGKDDGREENKDSKGNAKPGKSSKNETKKAGSQGSHGDEEGKQSKKPVIPKDTGCTQASFNDAMEKQFIGNSSDADNSYFGDYARYDTAWKTFVKDAKMPSSVNQGDFNLFIKSITPTVNMMATYFNMKKSASDFSKNSIQKTGQLSEDDLSYFKTHDDIFKRNEIVHDSKNHGIVMFIDWSGSMFPDMKYTAKQLFVLTEFCRKTQIPFEVYGFTDKDRGTGAARKPNTVTATMTLGAFKLLSSDMPYPTYKKMGAHIYNNICLPIGNYMNVDAVHASGLTPINSMAVISEYIINNFKQKFNRDKTIVCFLSDGDETDAMYSNSDSVSKQSRGHLVFRDSHNGKTYDHDFTKDGAVWHTIFKYVKEKCNVTKMVGFYLSSSVSPGIIKTISPNNSKKIDARNASDFFDKNKYVELGKDRGFDKYYVVSVANFDIDPDHQKKLNVGEWDTEKQKDEKIRAFLANNTKPLFFLKKFIQEIA